MGQRQASDIAQEILARTDLLALIERDLGPARKTGRWFMFRCPFHSGGNERTASLGVTPDNGRFKCFAAGCNAYGDALDWVMRREGMNFREACRRLGALDLDEPARPVKVHAPMVHLDPPGELWQSRAWDFLDYTKKQLWDAKGYPALEYLRWRGLSDDTIRAFHLGYNPRDLWERANKWGVPEAKKVYLSMGITIPCLIEDVLWYVQVRRPAETKDGGLDVFSAHLDGALPSYLPDRKYWAVRGSNLQALYGIDQIGGKPGELPVLLEEGEFNGMVVWQEASDLVQVLSVGSASVRPDSLWPWREWFLMTDTILVRFDPDAEKRADDFHKALSRRCHRVQVPEGNDTNEFYQRGGGIHDWIAFELARIGRSG